MTGKSATGHDCVDISVSGIGANKETEEGDLEYSLALWARHRDLQPTSPYGYLRAGIALRTVMRFDEADAVLAAGLNQASDRFGIAVHYAWVAHHRKDWVTALARWQAVAHEFPLAPEGHGGIGLVLIQLQRFDEAQTQLEVALLSFSDSEAIATVFAELAIAREDYRAAVTRLDAALAINPAAEHLRDMRGMASWHSKHEEEAAARSNFIVSIEYPIAHPSQKPVAVERIDDPAIHRLVMQFDNLGENCEFGLVQRRFNAEPLGLLRWTHTRPETLIHLLESQFSGFGEEGNVEILRPDGREYYVRDSKFGIVFHTFITHYKEDESSLLAKQSARLRWLRDKMLADLATGGKIFVYKFQDRDCSSQSLRLFQALSRYGTCRLLCASLASQNNLAGSVRMEGNGLFHSYLSRLNPGPPPDNRWEIPFDEWIAICSQVVGTDARLP